MGAENTTLAADAGLVYVHEEDPGIRRRRAGKGFNYIGPDGQAARDPATLERIRGLVIPPAWTDVWICLDPRGHIQATGRDAKGRKQYRYHERWRSARDETRFAHMAAFARALPGIRARVDEDLRRHALSHDKVLATVVRLLELTLVRVGNDEYVRANGSFGLTTLRNRHVRVEGTQIIFEFKGKSGVMRRTGVRDRRLARIVKALQDMPGQRLFQYVDETGELRQVSSSDVNAYLRRITGEDFTAKDFRTWAGTIAAAKAMAMQPEPTTEAEIKRATALCIKATAGLLGNTPSVCRSAYVHPGVITAFAEGTLPKTFATLEGEAYEAEVLTFLDVLTAGGEARGRQPSRRRKVAGAGGADAVRERDPTTAPAARADTVFSGPMP
jgi:DNA topoisomerase-1